MCVCLFFLRMYLLCKTKICLRDFSAAVYCCCHCCRFRRRCRLRIQRTWMYDFRKTYSSSSQIDRYECRQKLLLSENTHFVQWNIDPRTNTCTHTYDSQLPFHIWLFSLNLFRSDSLNVTLAPFLSCSLFLMFSMSFFPAPDSIR